ncbi:hypothetical protein quinque_006391 [Culex quinquefasciatus]
MSNPKGQTVPKPPATRRRMSRHGSVLIETEPRQIPWDLVDRLLVPLIGCHAAAIVVSGVLTCSESARCPPLRCLCSSRF